MSVDPRIASVLGRLERGQIEPAIEALRGLLAERPHESLLHSLLAAALLARFRLAAAEHELGIALGLDPTNAHAHETRARVLLARNRPEEALAACEEARRLEPEDPDPLLLAASCLQLLDDLPAARRALDEALRLAPEEAAVLVANADWHLDHGSVGEARRFSEEALAANPESADAHVALGAVALREGDTEAAAEHARYAVMQEPDSRAALGLLCNVKARTSPLLGPWWRFNAFVDRQAMSRQIGVLVAAYLAFNLAGQVLHDLGHPTASLITSLSWIGLVVYSWVGMPLYRRMLERELSRFEWRTDF